MPLPWEKLFAEEGIWANQPFQLAFNRLVGDRLEFHVELNPRFASAVRSARLLGHERRVVPLEVAPEGCLVAPVPARGDLYTLVIEAVDGLTAEAPPLPWSAPVWLSSEIVADFHAAESCGAALTLPDGSQVKVPFVLRRPDCTIAFWDLRGRPGLGHLGSHAVLLADGVQVDEVMLPYGLMNVCTSVYPDVLVGGPVDPGARLTLRFPQVGWQQPEAWHVDLAVPAGRPAAVAVGETVTVGSVSFRLEEVWLGLSRTSFVLSAAPGLQLHPAQLLTLRDDRGQTYPWCPGDLSDGGPVFCSFAPVPAGVTNLRLSGDGMAVDLRGEWDLPLAPTGSGRVEL